MSRRLQSEFSSPPFLETLGASVTSSLRLDVTYAVPEQLEEFITASMRLRGSTGHRKETGEVQGGQRGAPVLWRGTEGEKVKEQGRRREMAAGGITTLPASPDDGASGGFPPGNFKEPKRLYCKNGGYFLRINSDGRVDGSREKSDPHIRLQLQATAVGEVLIKGICANRYLAMSADGRLFGARRATDECYFFERLESNNYNTYRSRKYPDWYVALKRTGQYKSGSKTGPGQKAILFLPMSSKG